MTSAWWRTETSASISVALLEMQDQFSATAVFTGVGSEAHVAWGAGAGSEAGLDQACCCTGSPFCCRRCCCHSRAWSSSSCRIYSCTKGDTGPSCRCPWWGEDPSCPRRGEGLTSRRTPWGDRTYKVIQGNTIKSPWKKKRQ